MLENRIPDSSIFFVFSLESISYFLSKVFCWKSLSKVMSYNKLYLAASAVLLISILISVIHVKSVTSRFMPKDQNQNQVAEVFSIPNAVGPESFAFDKDGGGPYTGVSDGRIIKWQKNENRWINFAITTPYRFGCEGPHDHVETEARCGRPLGLSFNKKTGDLYIVDAYMGLLVVGPNGGLATPLVKEAQGIPFKLANDVVVDQNSGVVYFTDSSSIYSRREYEYIILSGDKSGRLLKFDPKTNEVTVLLNNLMFPNGVALSQNSEFLLVAETTNSRILKYWLEPSKPGRVEVFAQLPGAPDNIKMNQNGEFWVATNPTIGNSIAVRLNENGVILETLQDQNGETWKYSSDIDEENGYLWIGSVILSYAVRLKISN